MSKPLKTGKTKVELRTSKIRRNPPVRAEDVEKELRWRTPEREIKIAIIGVVIMALAINIVIVGFSAITN